MINIHVIKNLFSSVRFNSSWRCCTTATFHPSSILTLHTKLHCQVSGALPSPNTSPWTTFGRGRPFHEKLEGDWTNLSTTPSVAFDVGQSDVFLPAEQRVKDSSRCKSVTLATDYQPTASCYAPLCSGQNQWNV